LDGLRGVAIILVLLWHTLTDTHPTPEPTSYLFWLLRLSWSGVDLFFVLSGFLIGGILLDAQESPRYYKTFYLRRAYRILPLYGVALAIYALRFLPFLHHSLEINPVPFRAYASFTQNLWMASEGSFGTVGLAVTWSLAIEEQFYLMAPLIVRRLSRLQLTRTLVAVVLLAPVLRTILFIGLHRNCLTSYVLMPCRADALALGMLSAIVTRNTQAWDFVIHHRTLLYGITATLVGGVVLFTYEKYGLCNEPMATVGFSILAFLYTCFLLIALMESSIASHFLNNWTLGQIGKISYCVYLAHLPLIEGCRDFLEFCLRRFSADSQDLHQVALIPGALLGICITFIVAGISWRFLEGPMVRRGHAYRY
jgi:peptidoglycan/LPS O-acetylase OafA/YrhL